MLTTREMATLIWLVPIVAIVMVRMPAIRDQARQLVGIFLQPILLVPMAVFAAWMAAVVWFASQIGAWGMSLLKDTLYWVVPGFILMFGATKAATEPGFFVAVFATPLECRCSSPSTWGSSPWTCCRGSCCSCRS